MYVERRDPESASIERVFRRLGEVLSKYDINIAFEKAWYGNDRLGMLRNLLAFRPPTADIYHITGHVHYLAFVLPRSRTVLTIHDLIVLQSRRGLRRYLIRKLLFDLPARRVRYLTVSSHQTKYELLKITSCPEEKIRVIDLALPRELHGNPKPFNENCPTILQVGATRHKNLRSVARAVNGIQCCLRIVGKLSDEDRDILIENSVSFSAEENVSDELMVNEYVRADLVVFCSTQEGFGLPILEAQAMCVPLITSNVSPMKEIAGNGALLVDPLSHKEIGDAIQLLISDSEARTALVKNGMINVQRFSPERIAARFREVYEEVLADNNVIS
jgi:glycosyltransferase involved in cell wall biosynthesis